MRRASQILGLAVALVLLLAAALTLRALAATESDKGIVADLLSKALSSSASNVSIGVVAGALSSDIAISDVIVSDAEGPWLKLDKAHLVWNRLALLQRKLDVQSLEIGRLEILRRPLAGPKPAAGQAPGWSLPELPLKVIVKALNVGRIVLGAPVIGTAAELTTSGAATLGPPAEGLDLTLDARRLDAPGDFDLRLGFVPDTTQLTLHVKFAEPAGGLFARAANLPGAPPVDLAIDGEGKLDAFGARLALTAGPEIGADGRFGVARQGAERRLTATLRARVAGLLPPVAADLFAGDTALDAALNFGDDGALAVDALSVVSKAGRLDIAGAIDASRKVALNLQIQSLPGAPRIGSFNLKAKASGALDAMALQADAKARDAQFDFGRIASLDAAFHLTPNGAYGDAATRLGIDGHAQLSGVAPADPALASAIGANVSLELKADATTDGETHIAALKLTTDGFTANFRGDASRLRVAGKTILAAPDLSRFGALAGLALRGALAANADIEASPGDGAASATLDARATNVSSGIAALDGFAGGRLALSGGVQRLADGGFGFQNLLLTGAHGSARIDGQAAADKAAVHAEINAPDVGALDPRASGRAKAAADLTGTLAHLDATLTATLDDGRLLGRPTPRLRLTGNFRDLTGLPQGEAKLDGIVDARAATGAFSFAKHANGGLTLDGLSLALGSAHIDGRLTLQPDRTAEGHLAIVAAKLDDLSPLALTKLAGALDASFDFAATAGRQDVAIRAKSPSLSLAGADVAGLDVDLSLKDLFGAPDVAGHANIASAKFASETVSSVKLTTTAGAAGSEIDLRMKARGLDVEANGLLQKGAPKFTLARLSAAGNGRRLALLKPTILAWGGDFVDIDGLALGVDGGKLTLAGRVGATLNLKLAATSLPLAALDLAQAHLGLAGSLDAEASLHGPAQSPEGSWRASVAGLSAPASRAAGLAPLAIKASGAVAAGRTSVDLTLDAAKAGSLRLVGAAPLSATGALDLRATGNLDLALANPLLAVSGQRVAGGAAIDLRIEGAPRQPRALGAIVISHGALSDEGSGFKATDIEATLNASGDSLNISRASAATPNGGSLSAAGTVRLNPDAGFPGSLRLTGKHALLASNAIVSATAELDLQIGGALARSPKATGRIDIETMDIEIPGRLPSQAVPLADIQHIAPGPTARERLALSAKAGATKAAPFEASLDLRVAAPNRIFIRGRGVDAELSGALTLAGSTTHPQAQGGFTLRRGTFTILGKQLDFSRGLATFRGEMIPELDMLAETSASDITAKVAITGSAAKPTFTFSSEPALPQDEILSRILFDAPSGSLSAIQALQLANAASSLSGGPDAFERLRKSLGVDSLDIGSDASGGATVGVRRAINSRLSVGATSGAKPVDNGVSLDFDLTKRLRLQGGVNAAGGSTAGAGYQFEY